MTKLAGDTFGNTYPALGQGTVQNVAIGATHAESNAVGPTTASITMTPDADCWALISDAGTAVTATTGEHLPAGVKWVRRVNAGASKVSVLTKISGVTGNLNIVEDG